MPLTSIDIKQKEAESLIKIAESIFASTITGLVASFLALLFTGTFDSPKGSGLFLMLIAMSNCVLFITIRLRKQGFNQLRSLATD